MRLAVLFGVMALVALAFETTLPHLMLIPILIPNVIVILAVDLGLRHRTAMAAVLAFAMGYATDAFSGTHLGVNAFLVTLVFLLAYQVSRRLLVINAVVGAVAVFAGAMLMAVGGLALGSGFDSLGQAGPLMPALFLQALLTAIISPLVFAVLDICKRTIGLPVGAVRE